MSKGDTLGDTCSSGYWTLNMFDIAKKTPLFEERKHLKAKNMEQH